MSTFNNQTQDLTLIKNDLAQITPAIGTSSDNETNMTVAGRIEALMDHAHSPHSIYPLLANPITLTKGSGIWAAFPTPTEIVPANTITNPFDIHFISVNTISAVGDYVVQLYSGSVGNEVAICSVPVSRSSTPASEEGAVPTGTIILPANTRISAAISSGNAATNTLTLKIQYHIY